MPKIIQSRLSEWDGGAWTTVSGASITGNNKVWRQLSFAAVTTAKIRVSINATADGASRLAEVEAWGTAAAPRTNVALTSNGGTASASSSYSSSYPPSALINGDRKGTNWGNGGGWNDSTFNTFPDWVEVDFNGSKTIDEIDVVTVQDSLGSGIEPTLSTTFSSYGATGYDVQYWDGSAWTTVTGGTITGTNKVRRQLSFAAVTTTKIRVSINASADGASRLAEIEAWGTAATGGSSSGGINWLVTDQLGTPRMIFDQSGSLATTKRHDYAPFGEELFNGARTTAMGYAANDTTRQKFTQKERDNETSLDYFQARYYSSTQGRFTSTDKNFADQFPRNPQSWNTYSYVRNSPCSNVDVKGRCSAPAGLKPGETGICVETFIAAPTLRGKLGTIGIGDNRKAVGDDPKSTYRFRMDLILPADPNRRAGNIQQNTTPGTSTAVGPAPQIVAGMPVGITMGTYSRQGEATTRVSNEVTDKSGTTTFTTETTAKNGFATLPVVGALGPQGEIGVKVNWVLTSDSRVGLNEGGERTNYPSIEIYSYHYDNRGALVTQQVFAAPEGVPEDLSRPRVTIPAVSPK